MARQVLPLAGALIGGMFGAPQIGFFVGSLIGNAVDPQVIKTPGIKDLPTQSAGEGGFRQVVYGTCWINSTNVIDFGEVQRVTKRERQGKGGGPVVESELLYRTYAIGLGDPVKGIRVIRRNGKIVYDVRPGSAILADSAAFAERFRFYSGAEDQLPDPDLEALPHNGVGNTPSYRGTAYLVFPQDDLTDVRGTIPTYEVEAYQTGESVGVSDWVLITGADLYRAGETDWGDTTLVTANIGGGGFAPDQILVNGDNLVTWQAYVGSGVFASTDGGATFAASTGFTGTAGFGSYSDGAFYVGNVGAPFSRKSVALPAFTSLSVTSDWLGGNSTFLYSWGSGSVQDFSLDGGATWTACTTGLSVYFGVQNVYAANDSEVAVACTNNTDVPVVAITVDGDAFIEYTLPTARSATFARKLIPFGAEWVLFLDNGDIYVSSGTSWTRSTFVATSVRDAATDGTRIYAVGDLGYAITSTDGLSWSVVSTNLGTSPLQAVANYSTVTPAVPGDPVPLKDVIEDICDRCGIATTEYDFAALSSDTINGVTLGGGYDGASAMTMFFSAYSFDLVQPEKVLKALKRGGAAAATITADDFIDEPDENILRGQDIEYPRALMLKYLDPGQNYAAPAATVSRITSDSRVSGEVTIDLPISFDRDTAFQIADKILKVMWEELNGEITFSLPSGPFAWLSPGDCLGLSLRGALYRIRVTKIEETPWQLKVSAVRDRQSAYTSALTGLPLPVPTTPPPALPGATNIAIMNLPALSDGDDRLGIYVAMCGEPGTAWSGAQIEYRLAGATAWNVLGTYTRRAVMGELLSGLPAASEYYTDSTNTLEVSLIGTDELESLTAEEFLSEGNPAAIVYPDGTAEIVQFRDALETMDGWELTTLQRGRLLTTPGPHLTGAQFVMLEGSEFVSLPSSLIGQALQFRVTSLGTSPELAPVYDFDWNPSLSQTEFPPHDVEITRELGVISGSWIPRHRFGTDVNPIASVNFNGWRVTITDGTTTQTFTATSPEFSVSDASFSGNVTVSVESINRLTTDVAPSPPVVPPVVPPGPVFTLNNADFESGATGWAGLGTNSGTFTIINDPAEAYEGDWCGEFVGDLADPDPQYIFNTLRPVQESTGTAKIWIRFDTLPAGAPIAVRVRTVVEAVDAGDNVVGQSWGLWTTTSTTYNGDLLVWMPSDHLAYITLGSADTVRIGLEIQSVFAGDPASVGSYTVYLDNASFRYGS